MAAKRKGYYLQRQPGIELAEYLLSKGENLSFFSMELSQVWLTKLWKP